MTTSSTDYDVVSVSMHDTTKIVTLVATVRRTSCAAWFDCGPPPEVIKVFDPTKIAWNAGTNSFLVVSALTPSSVYYETYHFASSQEAGVMLAAGYLRAASVAVDGGATISRAPGRSHHTAVDTAAGGVAALSPPPFPNAGTEMGSQPMLARLLNDDE